MPGHATRRGLAGRSSLVARAAVAAALVGVLLTWAAGGAVRLDGTEGPNDGWLVVIAALLALGWTRPMERGSWIGVTGVLGASAVIAWTAVEDWLDNRDVLDAGAGVGLLLVLVASVALAAAAVGKGVELARPDALQ